MKVIHLASPDNKHTMCNHTGSAAIDRTVDIGLVDCASCLWALVRLLLTQLTGALGRLHVVERSKTTTIKG